MIERWLRTTAVALVATALTTPAMAQSPSNDDTSGAEPDARSTAMSDASGVMRLPQISVTATRSPIKAFEYPGMVTVIGRDRIDTLQPSTPDDILKFVPGVEFTGGPRRTGEVPSIRGFSGPDVVVLVDGARQAFDSGHDGRFFIDPALLREVEVLRGSASALYGSGGTGGVVEFRTIRAEDLLSGDETIGARVSSGYQTANREKLATATVFGRPTAKTDLVFSLAGRDSGSIELGNGSKLNRTDDEIVTGLLKGGFQIDDNQRIEASFQRFANKAEEPSNGQGLGGNDIVEKDVETDNWRLGYAYTHPTNDLIDLDVVAYYTRFQVDELRLDSLGAGPQGQLLERDVDTIGFRVDNRSRFEFSDSINATLTYGAEGYRDEQDGATDGANRDGVPDAESEFAGAFAQAEFRFEKPAGLLPGELIVIPGVRYDRFGSSSSAAADTDDDQVSPRIGASYLPTPWSLLFANFGDAFRAPTINELYTTGVHFRIPVGAGVTNRFVANPNLKPQSTTTFEFGGGLDFSDVVVPKDRLQVKVTHFEIQGKDFIDQRVVQPTLFVDCNPFIPGACDGTTRAENVANAELHGNEVEASYENQRVRIAVGVSSVDGRNTDTGAKLGVLTPTQLTVDTELRLPEIDSAFGWRMLAADEFNKVNTAAERRDGYAVHDIYFAWKPSQKLLRGLRIDLGVDNIFDKSYSRVNTNAPEPGRSFKALVSYQLTW